MRAGATSITCVGSRPAAPTSSVSPATWRPAAAPGPPLPAGCAPSPGSTGMRCTARRPATRTDRAAALARHPDPAGAPGHSAHQDSSGNWTLERCRGSVVTSHPAWGDPWQMPERGTRRSPAGARNGGLVASRAGLAVGVGGGDLCVAVRACQHRGGDVPARVVDEQDRRSARGGRPLVAPGHQRGGDREQGPALFCQVVLVAGRVPGVGAAFEDAVVGEFLQPGGQHAAGQAEAGLEVVEAAGAAERVTQDQQRPPLARHVQGLGDGAVPVRQARQLHARSLAKVSRLTRLARRGRVGPVSLLKRLTRGGVMTGPISRNRLLGSLKEAASWPGADRSTVVTLATALVAARADAEGSSYFRDLSERNPADATAQALAGFFAVRAGHDVAAALTKLDKAAAMDVGLPQYFRGLALAGLLPGAGPSDGGLAAADTGRADQVIADLEFVLAVRDQFPVLLLRAAYQGLARAYRALGRQLEAAEALRRSGLGPAAAGRPPVFTSFSVTARDGVRLSAPGTL